MTIAATTTTTTIAGRLIEESQISNTINKATRPLEGHSHAPPRPSSYSYSVQQAVAQSSCLIYESIVATHADTHSCRYIYIS